METKKFMISILLLPDDTVTIQYSNGTSEIRTIQGIWDLLFIEGKAL